MKRLGITAFVGAVFLFAFYSSISLAYPSHPILVPANPVLQEKYNERVAKVKEAAFDLDLANKQLKAMQDRLEDKFKQSPEWVAASAKLDAAKIVLSDAIKSAVASVTSNPKYVAAQAKLDDAQASLDKAKTDDDGPDVIAPLAIGRVQAAAKVTQLKTDCINNDAGITSAKAAVAAAQSVADQLHDGFVGGLPANAAWASDEGIVNDKKGGWVAAVAERDAANELLTQDEAAKEQTYEGQMKQYNDEKFHEQQAENRRIQEQNLANQDMKPGRS
jgi:hypothetical protein